MVNIFEKLILVIYYFTIEMQCTYKLNICILILFTFVVFGYQCGPQSLYTTDRGEIKSHVGYDLGHNYGRNLDCTWVIQAPPGKYVEVTAETFTLESRYMCVPVASVEFALGIWLLWIIYVISVLFCYAFMHVCLLMPYGHLLGKGLPLGSRL